MEISFVSVNFLYRRKTYGWFLEVFLHLVVPNYYQFKNNPYAKSGIAWGDIFWPFL